MLRGINRSIIEINETENQFFERILIFVKPEFGALPADRLAKEASRLVGAMSCEPVGLRRRMPVRKRMAMRKRRKAIMAAAVLGLTILAVVLWKLF